MVGSVVVTADDVISRWVGSNPPDLVAVGAFIEDASTLVRFEFPDIEARIDADLDDGGVPSEQVRLVIVRVVLRALRNPDNVRSRSDGPFSTTYAGDNPGDLWLTDDERAMLSGQRRTGGRAFTVDPTPAGAGTGWLTPGGVPERELGW
jgi:hypothetical protein